MSFQIHTVDTSPKASKETLAAIEQRYGFVPNLAGVFAESPGAFAGLLSAIRAFDSTALTLTPTERQVVLIAVSVENRCDYCTAAHSALASSLGLGRGQIDRLQSRQPLSDRRLETLRAFTTELVRRRGRVEATTVTDFLAAGFTQAQVLEVLLGIALKTLTNYANHIARPEVNEQFSAFLPQWPDAA